MEHKTRQLVAALLRSLDTEKLTPATHAARRALIEAMMAEVLASPGVTLKPPVGYWGN